MSAGDALGSCAHRGEPGHLPHPDGRPCIVNSAADRGPAPGVYSEDQLAAQRREVPGTSVQVEELHDRIAVLEQRNGALDANAEAAKQRLARLHRDHDRLLDQLTGLERRLELEVRATKDYAEQQAQLGHKLGTMRGELDAAQAQVDSLLMERQRWWQAQDRSEEDRALAALGITRAQVQVGQAVELLGRVYVARDLLVAHVQDDLDRAKQPGPFAGDDTQQLLEASGGLFVPIPEGHMLSVTVTPYDTTPEDTTG